MSIRIDGVNNLSTMPYNLRSQDRLHKLIPSPFSQGPVSNFRVTVQNSETESARKVKFIDTNNTGSAPNKKTRKNTHTPDETRVKPLVLKQRGPLVAFIPKEAEVVAAKVILASGDFIMTPEDLSKPKDTNGMSISQAQGTPSLRQTALSYSRKTPMTLTPQVLRFVRNGFEKKFRVLQLKRLGHALNFAPTVTLSDKSQVSLRGFNESFTIPMIASSLLQYAEQNDCLLTKQDAVWVSNLLLLSASNDIFTPEIERAFYEGIQNPDCKQIFSVSGGYDWHVTHFFFFRGFLIYCNRGYGSTNSSGVTVYRIHNRDKVTMELLSKLIQRQEIKREEWDANYSIAALLKTLNLEFVYYAKQKSQVVGNCTYPSTKCGVKVGLALKRIIDHIGDEDPPADNTFWKTVFDNTLPAYKGWNYFDKNLVIQDFVHDLLRPKKLQSDLLPEREVKILSSLIVEKISKKPEKYLEVSPYFK